MSKLKYVVILLLATISAGVYLYFDYYSDPEIIVISPSKYPYKIKAQAQESLLSKDTNQLIYQNFEKNTGKASKVNMVPDPEAPILLTKPQENEGVFALGDNNAPVDDQKQSDRSLWDNIDNSKIKPNSSSAQISTPQMESQKETSLKITKLTQEKSKEKIHKTIAKTPQSFYLQLGYYRSDSVAKEEWRKIQMSNKKHLANFAPIIKKSKKKTSGYHVQLLIGPYKEFQSAKYLCRKITLKNQKCIVIKN